MKALLKYTAVLGFLLLGTGAAAQTSNETQNGGALAPGWPTQDQTPCCSVTSSDGGLCTNSSPRCMGMP